jgi:hypothetical protein
MAFRVSAKAANPEKALLEKGADLRKRAVRRSRAGGMIGSLGMQTTISERQ